MIIDFISDLHGSYPDLEGGDLLIIAGDLTTNDSPPAWRNYFNWLTPLKYKKKIYIAGNHDGFLTQSISTKKAESLGIADSQEPAEYVCDNLTEFEGLKIYGSPWTPMFYDWYFMLPRGKAIAQKWDLIPEGLDILITHGPPFGILDTPRRNSQKCGCEELLKAVKNKKPRYHIFGHIHGGYGKVEIDGTTFINCAHMDEDYEPVNKAVRICL
jgi:Icc-related predicted phosphoesterase